MLDTCAGSVYNDNIHKASWSSPSLSWNKKKKTTSCLSLYLVSTSASGRAKVAMMTSSHYSLMEPISRTQIKTHRKKRSGKCRVKHKLKKDNRKKTCQCLALSIRICHKITTLLYTNINKSKVESNCDSVRPNGDTYREPWKRGRLITTKGGKGMMYGRIGSCQLPDFTCSFLPPSPFCLPCDPSTRNNAVGINTVLYKKRAIQSHFLLRIERNFGRGFSWNHLRIFVRR